MKNYGIIFDCDGTLVDSIQPTMESFQYALNRLGERPRTDLEIKKYFGAGADRIFAQLLEDEEKGLRAFEHYKAHQTEIADQMKLHVGVRELLEILHEHEVPMGVVTGRHAEDLEIVLKPHRISKYFQALVTDNHLPKSKPAPDGILLAAEQMNLPARQTLYVGDSMMDMVAAHAAGAKAVAALWDSLAVRSKMEEFKPEYLAATPQDVWTSYQTWTRGMQ